MKLTHFVDQHWRPSYQLLGWCAENMDVFWLPWDRLRVLACDGLAEWLGLETTAETEKRVADYLEKWEPQNTGTRLIRKAVPANVQAVLDRWY